MENERQQAEIREQALIRQTQELVMVVDEQTRQLKERDMEMHEIMTRNNSEQTWQKNNFQATVLLNDTQDKFSGNDHTQMLMIERMDLLA